MPATARIHLDDTVENFFADTTRRLYEVPANRYFVLTDLETLVEGEADVALAELRNGVAVTKREVYFMRKEAGFHSDTGIVFRPGSEVVLINRLPFSGVPADVGFSLTGYLLDE